jgi:DNA polymerase III delta prime subunit
MKELWTEKYRPTSIDTYVFRDSGQKAQVESWIKEGTIPHLLFSGSAGIGKTTLAKILINSLNVNDYDVLEINASRENSVDVIREKITGFVSTMPFGEFKIVLLDEADYMSPNGQAALRGVMETYASSARFILTCNYPNKIIPALHSRCQGFHIEKVDKIEFTARAAQILINEGVEFDIDTLDSYVKSTYPDLRKCLNTCQMNSIDNALKIMNAGESSSQDYKFAAVELFKQGRIRDARTLLCSSVQTDNIEEIYRWLYDNIELFGDTDELKDRAILSIRDGLVNHSFIADPEINLSATITDLCTPA